MDEKSIASLETALKAVKNGDMPYFCFVGVDNNHAVQQILYGSNELLGALMTVMSDFANRLRAPVS